MGIKGRNLSNPLRTGTIQLPLQSWRVLNAANDDVALVAATAAIGSGGVMGVDAEPKLIRVNTTTDKAVRLIWTASAVDPLINAFTVPADWDTTQPWRFRYIAASGGTADAPAFVVGAWPQGAAGTLVTSVNIGGTASSINPETGLAQTHTTLTQQQMYQREIAAPSSAAQKLAFTYGVTVNLEFTPPTHGTDTAIVVGTWVEYTRK